MTNALYFMAGHPDGSVAGMKIQAPNEGLLTAGQIDKARTALIPCPFGDEHGMTLVDEARYTRWDRATDAEADTITCPVCFMTSYLPEDVRQGYCGSCHAFTSRPLED